MDTFPSICSRILEEGHEIGLHGYCHEDVSCLPEHVERAILEKGISCIERLTGNRPSGYRAPYFRSSFRTQELLLEYGFVYDSSLMANDYTPYYERSGDDLDQAGPEKPYRFGHETDLVQVPVSWHLNDWEHYEMPQVGQGAQKAPSEVAEVWNAEFEFAHRRMHGGVLTLVLHVEVVGRGGRLLGLENLLDAWAGHEGVQIGRLDEYVDKWRRANARR